MPETRDRLTRHGDIFAAYLNRRLSGGGSSFSDIFIVEHEADDQSTGTPFRWRGTSLVGTPGPMRIPFGRVSLGTPRIGGSPKFGRSSALIRGRENMTPRVGSGRAWRGSNGRGRTVLPAWYPRKPFQDITAVVRAIERSRVEGEGWWTESPTLEDRIDHYSSASSSGAQLEQDISMVSPCPTTGLKCPPSIGKVPKILLNVANLNDGDSSCLTPQKKLLNNIDTVEKAVMQELRKLKRTLSAKKAEREKRLRTLMSMR